jgi:plastocyanin
VAKLQPGVTDAVITVRRIPEATERRLAGQMQRDRRRTNPRMVIQKSRYKPRVMAVAAGNDLEFQNLDRIWHSTFSVSTAQRFDLGKLKPGAVDTVTLARPGVINLHCDIHPEETGFLVVAPNHAYARPDSLGRFELPRLPSGSYEVQIWHPVRGSRERVVVVPSRGDAQCDLAF